MIARKIIAIILSVLIAISGKKIAVIVGDVNGHVGGSAEDFEDHEGGDFENRSGVENSFTYMVLV